MSREYKIAILGSLVIWLMEALFSDHIGFAKTHEGDLSEKPWESWS
jgi:hypothetical protein